MPKEIEKRFPADYWYSYDTKKTFLNDNKIDGELYAILMSISIGYEGKTIIYKRDIPTQKKLSEMLSPQKNGKQPSTKTIQRHLEILEEKKYLDRNTYSDKWIILNPESSYFSIPLDTLKFLNDIVKVDVIKAFIIFGQWWKNSQRTKELKVFTKKSLMSDIGLKDTTYGDNYDKIDNIMLALKKFNFIDWECYYENINNILVPKMKLTYFSSEIPKNKEDFRF